MLFEQLEEKLKPFASLFLNNKYEKEFTTVFISSLLLEERQKIKEELEKEADKEIKEAYKRGYKAGFDYCDAVSGSSYVRGFETGKLIERNRNQSLQSEFYQQVLQEIYDEQAYQEMLKKAREQQKSETFNSGDVE